MCVIVFRVCVCVHHVPACCPKMSKEALAPLELESQTMVSHHVGVRNWTRVLCKNKCCLTTEQSLAQLRGFGPTHRMARQLVLEHIHETASLSYFVFLTVLTHVLCGSGDQAQGPHVLGEGSTTELHPQVLWFLNEYYIYLFYSLTNTFPCLISLCGEKPFFFLSHLPFVNI